MNFHPASQTGFNTLAPTRMNSKISTSRGDGGGNPELLEYPFLTLTSFPDGFIQRLGGLVCCRSVKVPMQNILNDLLMTFCIFFLKLLDGEVEDSRMIRENWWQEIRQEIRSHARCLGCNLVVGYSEETSIWDDLVVLSASGTAVVGNLNVMLDFESVGKLIIEP